MAAFSFMSQLKLATVASFLLFCAVPTNELKAAEAVESTTLLKTDRSWLGIPYPQYPQGRPEITIQRIVIPPHTKLPWHYHPVLISGYVMSGALTIETRGESRRLTVWAGQAFPELMNVAHRGVTGDVPAELLVFYAGTQGAPLSVTAP